MKPRSLYKRIYMHFIGVLFAVGAVSSWIFAGGWHGNYLSSIAEQFGGHTAFLVAHTPGMPARARLLDEIGHELALDVSLYSTGGTLIAQSGAALPTPRPEELATATVSHFHRSGHWYVIAPVRPPGEAPLVLVGTSSSLGSWTSPLRPLAALFAVMMLVGLAVRPLARRIVRPIERLIAASRQFGDGDLSTRVQMPRWRHHHHHHPWARWGNRRHRTDELFTLTQAWNDMAERIERQVGAQRELLANVSHELRSPLARVRVALALLPEEEATRQRIADIEADLGELDRLIEDILQTSRLEATGLPNHTERVEVGALFDEVLARAGADPLTTTLDIAPPGEDARALVIEVDRALLRRALFNLIENAAKYGAPPVQLSVELPGTELALVVRDHGAGVPLQERERVVRPFSRGDRAHTPGRGGVGLGLSFAARVAAVHGGRLELDDATPTGLIVRLILPASRRVA